MTLKVLKFGGTSLATPERIERAVSVVRRALQHAPISVVVSAFGGVTNALLEALASKSCELAQAKIVEVSERYARTARSLGLKPSLIDHISARRDEALAALGAVHSPALLTPAQRDRVLASGEALSALIFEQALASRGIRSVSLRAEEIILTDAQFGAAQVDADASALAIRALGAAFFRDSVVVVAGFTGATLDGETTTLGRNASDYSAAILAAALHADLDIYTDVAGIFSADPKYVPQARVLPYLSFTEAATLAGAGAKVIHPHTLQPLLNSTRTIRVLDSFQPDAPGTCLTQSALSETQAVAAVALSRGELTAEVTLLQSPLSLHAPGQAEQALRAAGVRAQRLESRALSVRATVASNQADRAVLALHDRFVLGLKRVNVVVIGATGRVGRALIERLARIASNASDELGLDLKLVGIANSKRGALDLAGIEPGDIDHRLHGSGAFRTEQFWGELKLRELASLVVVDVTASAEVASRYAQLLGSGAAVVAANKLAPAGDANVFRELKLLARSHAPFLFETTVGAGLPVLKTLSELKSSGERLLALEAVLSGTLNFVCDALNRGDRLSDAVLHAAELGLTEPDPMVDLSGEDVARKLVILLRGAGIEIDRGAIEVEPMIPVTRSDLSLLGHLRQHDEALRAAADAARANGKRLVYRAQYSEQRARVALVEADENDPLARLSGPENLIRVFTPSYQRPPLTIRGPGAGVEVTAAGVLADILSAAAQLESVGQLMRRAA